MTEREKFEKWYAETGSMFVDMEAYWWECWQAALEAAPTPAALGDVVVTTDETGRAVAITRQDEEGRILSVIWEAPTPPTQEDEPVAEIVAKNTFGYDVYEAELIGAGVNLPKGTKLYTHPSDDKHKGSPVGASDGCETRVARYYTAADDKLRKAAEEVILWLDGDYMLSASHVLAKNLRAALEKR